MIAVNSVFASALRDKDRLVSNQTVGYTDLFDTYVRRHKSFAHWIPRTCRGTSIVIEFQNAIPDQLSWLTKLYLMLILKFLRISLIYFLNSKDGERSDQAHCACCGCKTTAEEYFSNDISK